MNSVAPSETENGRALQAALAVIAIWLFIAIGVPTFFLRPPNPIPAESADEFSADRAAVILKDLVGDAIPHPAGSAQNNIVRERITKLLEGYGYEVLIHQTTNNKWRKPGEEIVPLKNILAKLPGRTSGQAIMLASHYDSVPSGPGASDDGVGTAALLEIARMLKSEGPFEHDIIFLITDGEEKGLLGADKFVEEHPWADEVECVINLEARGTTGPSFMFETSKDSRWLIPVFDRSVSHPMTSSLFYEIYEQLPNDTDFTMFKRGGMQGFNFAYIGNVNYYHTDQDNFENADMGSLQHHGENMLGLARTLGDIDFDAQPEGRVVYFDVLGRKVIWWPAGWSLYASLIGLLLIVFPGLVLRKRDSETAPKRWKPLLMAVMVVTFGLAAIFAMAVGISQALAFDGTLDIPWPNFPWGVPFTFYFVALTVGAAIAWLGCKFTSPWDVWCAVWLFWSALTILVSWYLDGASFLFLVPLLAAGLSGLLCCRTSKPWFPAACGAIVCGFLWLPLEALFFDALGFKPLGMRLLIFRSIVVCFTALPVFAACNRGQLNRLMIVLGGGAVGALLTSILML